jgi:hypothetical protein
VTKPRNWQAAIVEHNLIVQSRRRLRMFRRNLLPPFSESKNQENGKQSCFTCLFARSLARLASPPCSSGSRDSAVGIATGYGLDDGWVGVRVPVGSRFSPLHMVHNSSGAHPASYPMCTLGSFPTGRAAGA